MKDILNKIENKEYLNPFEIEYIINNSDDICILDFGNNILIDINSSIYNSLDEETSNNIGMEFL